MFCWHKWSKWEKIRIVHWDGAIQAGYSTGQTRTCKKCGKIKTREVV